MGRPERSLDPATNPLAQFAADLRQARERAGRPTYRAMSRSVHRSQTTLSEAAGGKVLPTWETVQAFLCACGVKETADWRRRWEELADAPATTLAEAVEASTPAKIHRIRTKRYGLAGAGMLVLALAVTGILIMANFQGSPRTSANQLTPSALPPVTHVADGADPEVSGCANDPAASTVDATEVDVDQVPAGVIELRYSPQCGVSWPRFTPADPRYSTISHPGPIEAHVSVVPENNEAGVVSFSTRYVGLPVFGNVINSTATCVRAEAFLSGPAWQSTIGKTACYKGNLAAGR